MIIIADDLAGANDTAIQFTKCGLSALVLTSPDTGELTDVFDSYDVISINTDTREQPEDVSYRTVRNCVEKLLGKEHVFYKKIDSVLRGNTAVDLDAVMDALGCKLAVVAPSYPENDRVVKDGILYAGTTAINAVEVFSDGMHRQVRHLSLDEVRGGARSLAQSMKAFMNEGFSVLVADAMDDEDLAVVHEAAMQMPCKLLLSGSAGFAKQIALHFQPSQPMGTVYESSSGTKAEVPARILLVAGTRHEGTAQQILKTAKILKIPVIHVPVQDILDGKVQQVKEKTIAAVRQGLEDNNIVTMVVVDSIFSHNGFSLKSQENDRNHAAIIAGALAGITTDILKLDSFTTLITTGGDTSMKVCAALDATGIEPLEEVYPGVPLGRIIGGPAAGQQIITKSGGFGGDSSLIQILKFLGVPEKGKAE